VAPEGPVAVGEHRVLLCAPGQIAERLELGHGQLPAAQAVVREAEQLAHGLRGGRAVGERALDAAGLVEAIAAEGPAGVAESLLEALDLAGAHRALQ
jgi:hypothetical protein